MEEAKEAGGLLRAILPPKLEDAGLEDCALPPEAIKEAFFKAAKSIRSWAPSTDLDEDDDDCVQVFTDPKPPSDSLIGVTPVPDPPGPCGTDKGGAGGLLELLGDEVVDKDDGFDRLLGSEVVPGKESGSGACVDGLQGLKIKDERDGDAKGGEEKEKEPILAEDFV